MPEIPEVAGGPPSMCQLANTTDASSMPEVGLDIAVNRQVRPFPFTSQGLWGRQLNE